MAKPNLLSRSHLVDTHNIKRDGLFFSFKGVFLTHSSFVFSYKLKHADFFLVALLKELGHRIGLTLGDMYVLNFSHAPPFDKKLSNISCGKY